ncbi:MAG: hypothetical protein NWF05_07330 [Candidatus Bathyarchaeota archaeon]|nr:hypothetical protein [Candidatus Bathyarchaeota archaeon]
MKTKEEKKFLHEFNDQWRSLWRDLKGDKIHAEKVADKDYALLFVERGTVVKATAKVKPISYRETLKQHQLGKSRFPPPDPEVGGWRKFSRTTITQPKKAAAQKKPQPKKTNKQPQRSKKGGRGWLHTAH